MMFTKAIHPDCMQRQHAMFPAVLDTAPVMCCWTCGLEEQRNRISEAVSAVITRHAAHTPAIVAAQIMQVIVDA